MRSGVGTPLETGHLYHAAGTALAGFTWVVGNRARLTMRALTAIGGTWLICAGFAMMSFSYGQTMSVFGIHRRR